MGGGDALDTIYAGPKAALRPLHEQVVAVVGGFGGDVSSATKQAYVSLRRTKQFATVGPASGGRLEIGLNLKGNEPAGRLEATTGMCTHRVRLTAADEFDGEVLGWLRERTTEPDPTRCSGAPGRIAPFRYRGAGPVAQR